MDNLQRESYKRLQWLVRNQTRAKKQARLKRLREMEAALLEKGWFKLCIDDLEDDKFHAATWEKLVNGIPKDRWELLFQDLQSGRFKRPEGDRKRLQAYVGNKHSTLEAEASDRLQALHDELFCVVEDVSPQGSTMQQGEGPGPSTKDSGSGAERPRRSKRKYGGSGDDQSTLRQEQGSGGVPTWTRDFKLGRKVWPKDSPVHRNRRCTVVTALKSLPSCSRQCEHFDWTFLRDQGHLAILSFLIPCTHDSQLYIWEKSHFAMEAQVTHSNPGDASWDDDIPQASKVLRSIIGSTHAKLPEPIRVARGEMVIFLGHVMHAGAEWGAYEAKPNLRLHAYFLPADLPFPQKVSTVIPPPWIRRAFTWAPV